MGCLCPFCQVEFNDELQSVLPDLLGCKFEKQQNPYQSGHGSRSILNICRNVPILAAGLFEIFVALMVLICEFCLGDNSRSNQYYFKFQLSFWGKVEGQGIADA